ncbi:MAG: transcriptional regulator, MerR family [Acidobacteriales bacterium]|nr:transcriptional regulator, MerR family [Terriglobales bacterium]
MPMPPKSAYRSGELAHIAGVSPDTLRYYERKGILPLPQRTQSGYRIYPAKAIDRVSLIRSALSIGFSIHELSRILKQRDAGNPPCHQVHQLAKEKLSQVESQLREIKSLRRNLQKLVRAWDAKLANTPAGEPALLLASLKPLSRNSMGRRLRPKALSS